MGDVILAGGIETVGSWEPIQLYAGESTNGRTTQGTVGAGQVLGKLNARNETFKFPVVALVGGLLVAWDPLSSGQVADYFTGTLTIANAIPANNDTVTVNGTTFTFKTVPDADEPLEVFVGTTVTEAAVNLRKAVNAYRNEFANPPVTATNAAGVVTFRALSAVALAKVFATGANGTVSGAALAGGDIDAAEFGGAARPYGILPHALDTSATGYNAAVDSPVLIGGDYNFDALDLPLGTTYAEIKAAFARTDINIQQLY
jgi:hypothetical protein